MYKLKKTGSNRRTFVKAGAASAVGLAAIGWSPARITPARASGKNLQPLYVKKRPGARSGQRAQPSDIPAPEVRVLRKLTFGLKPGDVDAFMALGGDTQTRINSWVDDQLDNYPAAYPPTAVNDPDLYNALNASNVQFETLDDNLATLWQERVVLDPPWPDRYFPTIETQRLAFMRAVYSQWQLAEVLADFWHTHFSVDGDGFMVAPTFVHYDRDVIRANMLGNFRDMIEAVTKSTSMMYYLNNESNTKYGPNENYARELQELHTLGAVNSFGFTAEGDIPAATTVQFPGSAANGDFPAGMKAGYSEADVASVTRALTGWTISNEWNDGLNSGQFLYYDAWHEYNDNQPKRILGVDVPSNGEQETHTVLDMLAMHPNTARYICSKLCRRLIGDDPPQEIIDAAAFTFNDLWQSPDQLKEVVKTIVKYDQGGVRFWETWAEKAKRPFETVAGAMRSCGLNFNFTNHEPPEPPPEDEATLAWVADYETSWSFGWVMDDTGHMPYTWETPDGFPDSKAAWGGSTPLIMTWRCINWLLREAYFRLPPWQDPPVDPVVELRKFRIDALAATIEAFTVDTQSPYYNLPTNADNLVDYWVTRILGYDPPSGSGPKLNSAKRTYLIDFMRQNAQESDALDLTLTGWSNNTSQAYVPYRLQTLVASILMLPEHMVR